MICAIFVFIFLYNNSARGEDLRERLLESAGIGDLAALSEELGGIDVRHVATRLLKGELPVSDIDLQGWLERLGRALGKELTDALRALAAPVLTSLALRTLIGDSPGSGAIGLLCRVSCAALLTARFDAMRQVAEATLSALKRLVDVASPALIAALTLTGASERAAILTPSTALCAGLIEDVLCGAGLPLCAVAAAVAAAANLSDRFQLNRLFDLLRRGIAWGVSLMLAGFTGLMALQGLLLGGQDAVSARAIRRAIQAALPIVGGEVSDSAGALLGSTLAARNAVGVAGMLAVLGACALPIARLAVSALSLRIAAAVLEPVADTGVTRIVSHYADVARMLLAVCVGGTLLAVLLLGACLGLAGG